MKIRRRAVVGFASLMALPALMSFALVSSAGATPPPNHQVPVCHRTGSVDGGNQHNGYTFIAMVDIASSGFVQGGHDQHEQVGNGPGGDVIPAYDYTRRDGTVFHYPGKNLDATILGVSGAAFLAAGCNGETPPPETVHEFTLDADSHCDRDTGHVIITATFVNDGSESASVTATDVTFSGTTSGPVTIAAGAAHTFTIDTDQLGPLPGGVVRFDIEWANGDTESATANHSPTNGCGPTPTPTTPTPTPTTPPPTSPPPTSPPPTTPPTTTPPTPTHTRTHAPKCIAHPDRPACNTKTPPVGIAFTGSDSLPVWVSLVVALLLLGTGAMWAGSKRKRA